MATQKLRRKPGTPLGRDLIAGLREAVQAATTGDYSNLTLREIEVSEPHRYDARDVKRLRARLRVTQEMFARLIGVSKELVRHWEHDLRKPAPLACRLMDQIQGDPDRYLASLVRRRKVNRPSTAMKRAG